MREDDHRVDARLAVVCTTSCAHLRTKDKSSFASRRQQKLCRLVDLIVVEGMAVKERPERIEGFRKDHLPVAIDFRLAQIVANDAREIPGVRQMAVT